ncbi:hypothetical protein AXF42_Ash019367 [Apostasia shenzhenica]|uniref:DDT domain-containing protein n=1 Tax=Apostasia shenzhenica TaxID=1088818 RepID=A0A2H9ZTL5_9ASPA|nr:hypothetical protein AXF42_Ash019367 [Apostasia shenzhenica]
MKGGKSCPIKFCHKCLFNRYGEKLEAVGIRDDWKCPKCRGLCNCSLCMKKKGHRPTGMLVHTAKLSGFSSVHELLSHQGADSENILKKDATASPKKLSLLQEQVSSRRRQGKGNCYFERKDAVCMETDDASKKTALAESQVKKKLIYKVGLVAMPEHNKENLHWTVGATAIAEPPKPTGCPPEIVKETIQEDFVLPPGKPLTEVAGVELPEEDVGQALQFMEFCNAFSKVLGVRKGEPEAIIRELIRGPITLRSCRVSSVSIQFQIRLLSLILKDMGEEYSLVARGKSSWLKALGKRMNEYKNILGDLPSDFSDDSFVYNNLDSSKKLRILAFLCDEALGTQALRKYINEENGRFAKKKKNQTNELLPKNKSRPDVLRTVPLFLEKNGFVYWRLKNRQSSGVILQDINQWDVITPQDKWITFDEQHMIERYISFLRFRCDRGREQIMSQKNAQLDCDAI